MSQLIEWRVRPVTRYIITRFEQDDQLAGSQSFGTYDDHSTASTVAEALSDKDLADQGWAKNDPRMIRPSPIGEDQPA